MQKLRFMITAAAVLLLAVSAATAQDDTTDIFDFDDLPVDDVRPPYLGVGGGYLGMLTFMNFDELNKLNREFGIDDFDGQLLLNGGGGVTAVGVIANVRLGVFGLGGSVEKSADVEIGGETYKRTMTFGVGVTAAQFDYAIPLFEGLTAFPGTMLGAGRYSLELTQTKAQEPSFTDLMSPPSFTDPAVDNFNRSTRLHRTHLFYYPAVNLEYVPIQFLMIRAGVGYAGHAAIGGEWADQAGTEITDVPDIKADGLTLQFGVFVGLFQR